MPHRTRQTQPQPQTPSPPPATATILTTEQPELFQSAVTQAAQILQNGDLVGLPTETVYGLAANAFSAQAVAKIFQAKGRPSHNPIIVHVASLAMARDCCATWPDSAQKLVHAFWPGPLTLVLPRSPQIPDIVTAGGPTVGIRWPSHPFAQAVIKACGFPIAAPSANKSNAISPTTAEHVAASLGSEITCIVDGGACNVGIESTVLDLTSSPPRILRPGMIDERSIAAVIGPVQSTHNHNSSPAPSTALPSPGMLPKHYSPKAQVRMLHWNDDQDLLHHVQNLTSTSKPWNGIFVLTHTRIPHSVPESQVIVLPHDPEAFARALYAQWHHCDQSGARWILIEQPPDQPEWKGILDRIQRASAPDANPPSSPSRHASP